MLPGVVGVIQANEALKILVGYGEPLIGRLLMFDAQPTTFRELKLRRDPKCATCGADAPAWREFLGEAASAPALGAGESSNGAAPAAVETSGAPASSNGEAVMVKAPAKAAVKARGKATVATVEAPESRARSSF